MSIISIEKLGDESFLLKMKDKKSFDVLVETIKGNFGYSFNQNLQLNADLLEIGISGVSEENLKRHLEVVKF
ncbi:hypothetical protein WP8W18E11_25880 [Acinetobacter baumannii]|uniref:hypothetical protein n=1 Tax=Acinetobacter baumannii TaxID=470 RepID=UPI0015DC4A11|nr:hypothetical protein [Acinetobacter baumannii]BBT50058.1 hypothetical protein WP8W18E11_25880 [Acinetobacter baumannii]